MSTQPPPKAPRAPGRRAASFLGWSFAISLLLHLIVLPFFHGNKAEAEKEHVSQLKVTQAATPKPTPKPTPPPTPKPTPPPKQTPPPKTTPPPQQKPPPPHLTVHPPKTTSKSVTGPSESKYITKPGTEEGVPQGVATSKGVPNTAAPGPEKTGVPATAAPTPIPATPKPTPACPNPNADAAVRGTPVEPDYPDVAREQGAVGTATVKVTLSATGAVESATINKSAGNAALDQAAIAAAKATSYIPETVDCVKTAGSYLFNASFTSQ